LAVRKKPTKAALDSQAKELVLLRGVREVKEWCVLLAIPARTYYRYEGGKRKAPGALMKLARTYKRHGA